MMSPDLDDPQALQALVRPDEVHRALYLDPAVFDLEMRQLWRNTWIYLGHDSQVPQPGDFYATQVAREPLIMIRGGDGLVRVLPNRCAHKGTKLLRAVNGRCAGGVIRCPYHGWTYRHGRQSADRAAQGGLRGNRLRALGCVQGLRPSPPLTTGGSCSCGSPPLAWGFTNSLVSR